MKFTPLVVRTPSDTPYHENPREELVGILQQMGAAGVVLDVGCGAGLLGERLLTSGTATRVIGVEVHRSAAAAACERLSQVIVGDVSSPTVVDELPEVDVLVAADVLEHLVSPGEVLRALARKLRPGGVWLVSVPNVRHFSVLRDLVFRDDWEYQDVGICDATHLRFFTRRSLLRLCEEAGLVAERGALLVAGRSGLVARLIPPTAGFMGVQIVAAGRVR